MYRLNASWSGDSAKIDDYLYFYSVYKNKTKSEIRKIDIGLTTISGCDFTIKRENKFDRFSQKIRISNKIKIENDFLEKTFTQFPIEEIFQCFLIRSTCRAI